MAESDGVKCHLKNRVVIKGLSDEVTLKRKSQGEEGLRLGDSLKQWDWLGEKLTSLRNRECEGDSYLKLGA